MCIATGPVDGRVSGNELEILSQVFSATFTGSGLSQVSIAGFYRSFLLELFSQDSTTTFACRKFVVKVTTFYSVCI